MPSHGVPPPRSGKAPHASPEPALTAAVIAGLLADDARLRCAAAVVLGASTAAEVAERTGLDAGTAVKALERLAGAGLVERGSRGLAVDARVFQLAARAAAAERPAVDPAADLGATPEQASVLRNFVGADGRLTSIPTVKAKRLVVLDFLAGRFEPGRVYVENDVNGILGRVHDDYAALRRYLVDEGFLERRDGFYWRAGGTFDV